MRKLLSILLCAACVLTLCTACGTKTADTASGSGVTLDTIHMGTGGSTGTYYAFSQVVGQIIGDSTGYKFDVATSGGSKDNIESLVAGTYDMAIVQNDVMSYAYNGKDMFDGKAIKGFSVIGSVYVETVQIIAKANSGIEKVADLKGKRVSVGDAGSGVEFNARQILDCAGIDMEKDIVKNNLSFGDSASALKDGNIDAFFCVAGAPTTAITELATNTAITAIALDDDMIKTLKSKYSFYAEDTITHDDYSFISETTPVKAVGVMATYIVSDDLSEEQVYKITKALWEGKDKISAAHAKGKEMDIKLAVSSLGGVPLHKGAEKYYKEAGII